MHSHCQNSGAEPALSREAIGEALRTLRLKGEIPLFSFLLDGNLHQSSEAVKAEHDTLSGFLIDTSMLITVHTDSSFLTGTRFIVRFDNKGVRERIIENLVPSGEDPGKVYITAAGTKEWPQYLCRSRIYRPGYGPVGVVLPDNAWHLGFASMPWNDSTSLTSLARRIKRDNDRSKIDRWAVTLLPEGWVEFSLWFESHPGTWHDGLALMFRERWLYDMPIFSDTLFDRKDLRWMRSSYLMLLQFAWDKQYYNHPEQRYTFYDHFFAYDSLTGGWDIFTLWPTWPRLGLDQRNQWDMYRDLPGGIPALRRQADLLHSSGRKYFISYNPWDESGRKEDHLKGMAALLREIDADGVVLDTRGASSRELQAAADQVKPGIIMYSEGMAVPKDMPLIVSGRVHDALWMPPPLNLNKLIKPDFAIFRVLQLADDHIHRELAVAFFNGYGAEVNTMRPGRPEWINEEFRFMGRTTKLLRENDHLFHQSDWMPLVPTLTDSVYVNRWKSKEKYLFTILSLKPEGFSGYLFETMETLTGNASGSEYSFHWIDLWNHQEIEPSRSNGKLLIPVEIEPFSRTWLNTRREGQPGCVAAFPSLLMVRTTADSLFVSADSGDEIVITHGNPSYSNKGIRFPSSGCQIPFPGISSQSLTKIVIQLFEGKSLLDERVIRPGDPGPRKTSTMVRTAPARKTPANMVRIPAGKFPWYTRRDPSTLDPFIAFPDFRDTMEVEMKGFFMDEYPVTNGDFESFLNQTGYQPDDSSNFLRHWESGRPPAGSEKLPVVWISRQDAKAYADWAGKRLPEEMEWQYAAQGNDFRKYPWGNVLDSSKCNYNLNYSTPVDSYPMGASPFGVKDMIGNVWQLMADEYDNGSYHFSILRGGSFYHPTSSIWYVTGGPLPADHPEMLLLIAPSLDRNATVGFRCVKDMAD